MEALLYGCMTWAPCRRSLPEAPDDAPQLPSAGHRGSTAFTAHVERCRTLKPSRKPGAKVWKRQFASDGSLFAGALARQSDKRLPQAAVIRRETRRGGRPGARPAGTALTEKLEGRLQGIRIRCSRLPCRSGWSRRSLLPLRRTVVVHGLGRSAKQVHFFHLRESRRSCTRTGGSLPWYFAGGLTGPMLSMTTSCPGRDS